MTEGLRTFTPREIVSELDRYIVGQQKAKRAVAVALRNRWRRQQVEPELRDEIAPKNIIMIGPTGVGKTEIARRLAKLANAPFIKVEASKFTEVGYVGRDVEAMIRDLVEIAVRLVRDEEVERVQGRAEELAEQRLAEMIARKNAPTPPAQPPAQGQGGGQMFGPFFVPGGSQPQATPPPTSELERIRQQLRDGELDDEEVEVDVADNASPFMQIFGGHGMEEMEVNLRDMLGQLPGFKGKTKRRTVGVPEALEILKQQEAEKLVDMDRVKNEALERTQQAGIVFLDEIDKVAGRQTAGSGPDVSREGVQRDLLPIVEGSTVSTKYGPVKTDHILFIAAGAFHVAEVGDLIPELQGRFPIRVELDSLEKADFVRILTEPQNSLTRQYEALLKTEGLALEFTDDAIEALAAYAQEANTRSENIGARRLHTILEALLEEVSFVAPEMSEDRLTIDASKVRSTLQPILSDDELARYIL
ncbi:MAG TPA: ATP-dependent protease ATPase subunit HslU [Sandaracinaceae bacterium LLY-WYZ-13_1]|nr:ATP-dependent protease ATPase subunit HslU [Sandaracinaceae bacterium LLY-WYZ-13_1]